MNRRGAAAIAAMLGVALALSLAGCDGEDDPIAARASEACSELNAATTPIERRVAESHLLNDAPSEASEGELGAVFAAMVEQCPDQTRELLGIDEHAGDVTLVVSVCDDNEASGTVTNHGDTTLNVRIAVRVVDSDDTLLDTSSTLVDGLEPGQNGRWEAYHTVDDADFTCKGEIEQVTPQ